MVNLEKQHDSLERQIGVRKKICQGLKSVYNELHEIDAIDNNEVFDSEDLQLLERMRTDIDDFRERIQTETLPMVVEASLIESIRALIIDHNSDPEMLLVKIKEGLDSLSFEGVSEQPDGS